MAKLENGDVIGYDEYGTPDGPPVFVLHGNPGSRLDVLYAGRETLDASSARLVAFDRPGIGRSTPHPGRRLVDWPAEMNLLADALGMQRYAVIGGSAGAPYALACALQTPERLTGVGVMSPIGPPDGPPDTHPVGAAGIYFSLARRSPVLLRGQLWLMSRGLRQPSRFIQESMSAMSDADKAFLAQRRVQAIFLKSLTEALRDVHELAEDAALAARPWGFSPDFITVPVHVWHGEADENSPIAAARYLAATIPDSITRFFPDEGHFSMLGHLPELIEELAREWTPPGES
jgi:pimeloyl-ACP methyl ester carboxylesterase